MASWSSEGTEVLGAPSAAMAVAVVVGASGIADVVVTPPVAVAPGVPLGGTTADVTPPPAVTGGSPPLSPVSPPADGAGRGGAGKTDANEWNGGAGPVPHFQPSAAPSCT